LIFFQSAINMHVQPYIHNSASLDFDSFVFEAGYLDDEEDISGKLPSKTVRL